MAQQFIFVTLSAALILTFLVLTTVNADTIVLHTLRLNQPPLSKRYEIISLQNAGTLEEALEIKGERSIKYRPPIPITGGDEDTTEETTTWIADRNGYRVLVKIILHMPLSSTVLKAAAG